jgi:hypothetical protein
MLLTLGLFAAGFASAATSTSPIDIGHCEFGEVAAFGTTGCQFQLVNTTDEPLAVSIKPRNPADAVDPAKVMIPVGGSANIDARISVGDTVGEVKHSFRVTITDVSGEGFAVASGFAVGALDQVRPGIAFGNIDLTNPPPR